MKGLYIHIPFCESICTYCDFPKRIPNNNKMIDDYLVELKNEFLFYNKEINNIDTIYIGGGTPSMLNTKQLKYLFDMLLKISKVKEFTIECNPESLNEEKIDLFLEYKINRISLGVQTFNNSLLKVLGRKHTNEQVFDLVKLLNSKGLNNINIDMMFAIPTSTIADLKNDINTVLNLSIKHISYYSFILEDKTIIHNQYHKGQIDIINNDTDGDMYETVIDSLTRNDFIHYEISNFSKDGFQSIHNKIYWMNKQYVGIGLGASGYIKNIRYTNHNLLRDYKKPYIKNSDILTLNDIIANEMILGLRLIGGISISEVNQKYNMNTFDTFPFIKKFINQELLIYENDMLRFSKRGLMMGNNIFASFI